MDFFEAQDQAKRKTKTLIVLFIFAVLATGLAIYLVLTFALSYANSGDPVNSVWNTPRFIWTMGITTTIMVSCSLFKISSLKTGGGAVARMLGGQRLEADPDDPKLRQLRNVVEEMALASGVHVPEIFILENELSINAFAAGYTLDNAAVAVSRGALDQLDREELQGVVAHEFSHILNGDMRINTRLVGIIFGILVVAVIGRTLLYAMGRGSMIRSTRSSSRGKSNGGAIAILGIAFAIMIIGYIGVFFGRLIQSAISRQREYLADAAAVQFTRNPAGISNALRRIKAASEGSRIRHPDAAEISHMFFANGFKLALGGSFATHPPLKKRIAALDPNNIHIKSLDRKPETSNPKPKSVKRDRADFVDSITNPTATTVILAGTILDSIPQDSLKQARSPEEALKILSICLDPANTSLTGEALAPLQRFALLEIALATVKSLEQDALADFVAKLHSKAESDNTITIDEQCLLIAVQRNLTDWNRNVDPNLCSLSDVKKDFEIILSAFSLIDAQDDPGAVNAFEACAQSFSNFGVSMSPELESARDTERLNLAIFTASHSLFIARKALIDGASRISANDGILSDREQTLIRSLCLALACPLPR